MDDLNLTEVAESTSNSSPFFCQENIWPIVGVAAAGIATGMGLMYACSSTPAGGVTPGFRVDEDKGTARNLKTDPKKGPEDTVGGAAFPTTE